MYISCPELVFVQLNTTGWTNDEKTKTVNLSHNSYRYLKKLIFWQRKGFFSWNRKYEKQMCFI